jgi:hypothetical protein
MVSDLLFYKLMLIALVWLCLMLPWAWPSDITVCPSGYPPKAGQSAVDRVL